PCLLFSLGRFNQLELILVQCQRIDKFLVQRTVTRHPHGCIMHAPVAVAVSMPVTVMALFAHLFCGVLGASRSGLNSVARRWACGSTRRSKGASTQDQGGSQGGKLGGMGDSF